MIKQLRGGANLNESAYEDSESKHSNNKEKQNELSDLFQSAGREDGRASLKPKPEEAMDSNTIFVSLLEEKQDSSKRQAPPKEDLK